MIHETATVHPDARLSEHVEIEAYAVIGAHVSIGEGCRIGAHAVIQGPTSLGRDNIIGPHAVLGTPPQDKTYRGESTRLEIGNRNTIREFASIHRASTKEEWVTRVGDDNLFMANCHIGHDCVLGNNITIGNSALAGHVLVEDNVTISGMCGIHQFTRIGANAMLGGGAMVVMDIPPYAMASGNHARLFGLNRRGLQRNGFAAEDIRQLRTAYRLLFAAGLRLEQALAAIQADTALDSARVSHLVAFIRGSKRGLTR